MRPVVLLTLAVGTALFPGEGEAATPLAGSEEARARLQAQLDRPPTALQLPYTPAEGSTVSLNPPSFIWVPVKGVKEYLLQWSPDPNFPLDRTTTVTGLKLSLYTPAQTLTPGHWYWRYGCEGGEGVGVVYSRARTFTVPPEATELPLPPCAEIRRRVPTGHPRLYVRPEELATFRRRRKTTHRALWEALQRDLEKRMGAELTPEPAPYPTDEQGRRVRGREWAKHWRQMRRDATRASHAAQDFAFGYLASGDPRYAAEAKRWLLHCCTWDPQGTSSLRYNDEAAMPLLYALSRAYDWIYDTLTEEERRRVQEVMRQRGAEAYVLLRRMPFHSRPFSSHPGRFINFLGELSIAFLGDFPEAAEWLDYIVQCYRAVYPAWASDDGGWAEGVNYWKWYIWHTLHFTQALQVATGLDLHRKPFYRNTGYWKLYCHPPYSKMSPFGDGAEKPADANDGYALYRLSSLFHDPVLRWYSDFLGIEVPGSGFTGYLWYDPDLKGQPPTDLPSARLFPHIGWVALHSALGSAADDIHFMLKSSPYGSHSHSHADQNSFILHAFGEPLAIDSGYYYPYYGAPHHAQWTRETRAHNALTVDGQGQETRSKAANGRITRFLTSEAFDYAVGEAVNAYGGRLRKCDRHVLFIKPEAFVLFDDLQAAGGEHSFEWWLHALEEMQVDEATQTVTIRRNRAALRVHFLYPPNLKFTQTDQFAVPAEGKPNQWHLTATPPAKTAAQRFLTLLLPYRVGGEENLPEVRPIEMENGLGVELRHNGSVTAVAFGFGKQLQFYAGMLVNTDGTVAALSGPYGWPRAGFVRDATYFSLEGVNIFASNAPLTASLVFEEGVNARGVVQAHQATEVTFPFAFYFAQALLDGKELPPDQWGEGAIRLTPGEHQVELNVVPR